MSKLQLVNKKIFQNTAFYKPVKLLLLGLSIVIVILIIIYLIMKINSNKIKLLNPPVGKYNCEMMEYGEIWAMYKIEVLPDGTAKYSMGDYSKIGSWTYSKDTKLLVISNDIGKYQFNAMDSMYDINENGIGWGTTCNMTK